MTFINKSLAVCDIEAERFRRYIIYIEFHVISTLEIVITQTILKYFMIKTRLLDKLKDYNKHKVAVGLFYSHSHFFCHPLSPSL